MRPGFDLFQFMEKAVTYTRSPVTRETRVPYETKFADLIKVCDEAKSKGVESVIISWPWVIGDTYEEVIESISRLADAGLTLHVIKRGGNEHRSVPGAVLN